MVALKVNSDCILSTNMAAFQRLEQHDGNAEHCINMHRYVARPCYIAPIADQVVAVLPIILMAIAFMSFTAISHSSLDRCKYSGLKDRTTPVSMAVAFYCAQPSLDQAAAAAQCRLVQV